jgi:phosphoglycolate phosphatase-like HAD superfamily hydrolase
MLILFDIDGTLVDTGGAGVTALQDAAVEVFGGVGPPLDLAGST